MYGVAQCGMGIAAVNESRQRAGKRIGAQLMRKIKKVMDLLQVNWRALATMTRWQPGCWHCRSVSCQSLPCAFIRHSGKAILNSLFVKELQNIGTHH